jgi:hypothetical protein
LREGGHPGVDEEVLGHRRVLEMVEAMGGGPRVCWQQERPGEVEENQEKSENIEN